MQSAHLAAQGQGRGQARARPAPNDLSVQTSDPNARHQRFSWQETPLEAQKPQVHQFSSPTNSTIDESPISPPDSYQPFNNHPQAHVSASYPVEKPLVERTGSPYNIPAPTQTHPAYFAPVVEHTYPSQPELRQPASTSAQDSQKGATDVKSSTPAPAPSHAQHRTQSAVVIKPDADGAALVYDPKSLTGPNADLGNHRPGQVAHPNATIDPEWKHGLCEVDTLCCIGLCCPCILYGKTQYRITRKTQKEDPTNMLGYESCNGSCGLMAFACGFQWLLASIQRARIRKLYHLNGSFGSDCLKSLCCCCCVLMQDEREVRDRDESFRRNAGPASTAYTTTPNMTYAPPPR